MPYNIQTKTQYTKRNTGQYKYNAQRPTWILIQYEHKDKLDYYKTSVQFECITRRYISNLPTNIK